MKAETKRKLANAKEAIKNNLDYIIVATGAVVVGVKAGAFAANRQNQEVVKKLDKGALITPLNNGKYAVIPILGHKELYPEEK